MKPKLILCLWLVLSGVLAIWSAIAAEQGSSPVLQVVVKPSKTEVRVKEPFAVALRVENLTATNQTVRVMNCSWNEEWQTSNPKISWIGWNCDKNFAVTIQIPPGGSYTNEMKMLIRGPIPDRTLSFRMGFTPIGSQKIFWSNEETIEVVP